MTDIAPTVRWANQSDYSALGEVMFDAVRNGRSLYDQAQRAAWVAEPRNGPDWFERLERQCIIVAERDAGIMGFMSLAPEGYIDFAFVRPTAQGSGLFRRLYQAIEARAREDGEARLWVHASLMAEPAFGAMGFRISRKETVSIGDQSFKRFVMEKVL